MTKPRHWTELRARLVSTVLALLCLSVVPGPVSPAQAATDHKITVLLGTSGVSWNEVSVSTPNLLNAAGWPAGSLAARSVGPFSCPVDGWLAVSSGARARGREQRHGCDGQSQSWSQVVAQAGRDPYRARPGLLGQTLAASGVRSFGIGPGARIALSAPAGKPVGTWQQRSDRLGEQVRASVAQLRAGSAGGRLLVVDLGDVTPARRTSQTTAVDTRLGQVLSELPEGSSIVLASLADGAAEPHLQAVALRESDQRSGLLTSESTRQPGYVTATDITPTLLAALGVETPATLTGSAITPGKNPAWSGERLTLLRDPDLKAQRMHRVVPYFVVLTYLPILGLFGWLWWRARRQTDPHWPATVRPFASFVALIPAATFLANLVAWWRSGVSLLMVELAVLVIAAALSLPLLLGAPRLPAHVRPWAFLGWPGLVTAVVFAVDLLTGSRLQISSMIGLQPLVAGRFYGLGNPQFAIFGTAAVLLAGAISGWLLTRRPTPPAADHWSRPRRLAAATTLTIGVLALALDATPGLGSDFGGPPALLPAFLLLTTLILGFAVTWRRVLLAALATLALSMVVCVVDWLRPAGQRTHLGRVVQTALDGGLAPVIERKLGTNLALLVAAPYNLLIPAVTVFGAWYLLRPRSTVLVHTYGRAPVVKHVLVAWFVMLAIAFVLNDSGVVVPPLAAVLMLPALLAFLPWPNQAGGPLPQAAPQDSARI